MAKSGSKSLGLAILGGFIGGLIGFLLRPSAFLVGQLPFGTVISRGSNLQGLDQLLVGTAQTSFNIMMAGVVAGAVLGAILGKVWTSPNSAASEQK